MSSVHEHLLVGVVLGAAGFLAIGCQHKHTFNDLTARENEASELEPVARGETASAGPATAPAPEASAGGAKIDMGTIKPTDAGITPSRRMVVVIHPDGSLTRTWPTSVAYMASGDVPAGPTYWPNVDKAMNRSDWVNPWLEPLEFLANVGLLPVRAVLTPPWTPVVYSAYGPPAQEASAVGQPWLEKK